jgi:hypothetical protein
MVCILALFTLYFPCLFAGNLNAQPYTHPHLVVNQTDIDRIYSKIISGQEPWHSQYQLVVAEADTVYDFPYLWNDDKIRQYDWAEFKLKADLGARRVASLTLAYLYSRDPVSGAKLRNHVLGWCNLPKLAIADEIFTNWNHAHPIATLAIVISMAYDLNEPSGIFSASDATVIKNWLATAVDFIMARHQLNLYWSNQKAWNNAAFMLCGLLLEDASLVDLVINNPENPIGTSGLISRMINEEGQICDFWQGCYDIWHSLLTLNAFALVASAGYEHGYPNLFETEPKLPLSFQFFAPLLQTNDPASIGPGYSLGDPPQLYHLHFSGIYEMANKLYPDNETIQNVLTDPDFNIDTGRFCRVYRQGDTCSSCSRWIKFPLLLWGEEIGFSRVKAKLLLQGFHAGQGEMHINLQQNDCLPHLAPYENALNYVTHFPANAVDWVRVTLLNQSGSVAAQTSALLRNDGELMDINGQPGVTVDIQPGLYYLAISHRNHLRVTSTQACSISPDQEGYWDLTLRANFSQDSMTMIAVEPELWAVRCGDVNQDGHVTSQDYVAWYEDNAAGASGYEKTDLNGDGAVDLVDYFLWRINAVEGGTSADDFLN